MSERSDPFAGITLSACGCQVGGDSLTLLVLARTRPSLAWIHTERGFVPSNNGMNHNAWLNLKLKLGLYQVKW